MRIAVCDDEKKSRDMMIELIREYNLTRSDRSLTLSVFASANELLNFIEEYNRFDLYILDIIMPRMSGIQLGSALRESGDEGMIVYLTTSPDFAVDSYTVEAFHYLLKPIDAGSLFHCLDRAVDRFIQFHKNAVAVRTARSIRMLPIQDIRYAERTGRLICYHMRDGSVINSSTFNGTFKSAVAGLLTHKEILPVGSSFAVNLRYITEITRHDLIIDETCKIAIPRGKYEAYKTKWSDYWLNEGVCHVI